MGVLAGRKGVCLGDADVLRAIFGCASLRSRLQSRFVGVMGIERALLVCDKAEPAPLRLLLDGAVEAAGLIAFSVNGNVVEASVTNALG